MPEPKICQQIVRTVCEAPISAAFSGTKAGLLAFGNIAEPR